MPEERKVENELTQLRRKLDETDSRLLAAYEERMALVRAVAAWKKENGKPVYDAVREQELLERIREKAKAPAEAEALYEELLRQSRSAQRNTESKRNETAEYGLLGQKIAYSLSPRLHELLGIKNYRLIEKEPKEIEAFLQKASFTGLNVTIPYKKTVLPYLDEIDPAARKIGAVNTLRRTPKGKLKGSNTDAIGFAFLLKRLGLPLDGKKALILGTGGAAVMARYVLEEAGAAPVLVSRRGPVDYSFAGQEDAELLVNATPLGTEPGEEVSPAELLRLPKLKGVIDLTYAPLKTRLLQEAESRGLRTAGGLLMLAAQGIASEKIWAGKEPEPDPAETEALYRQLRAERENIVLIGLPGSGKSTMARMLAGRTGRTVYDTDLAFQYRYQMSPAEYIRRCGEEAFREEESAVIRSLRGVKGAVIATGGGSILREENLRNLKYNGYLIFLDRSMERLSLKNTPLADSPEKMETLARIRRPLYLKAADAVFTFEGSRRERCGELLRLIEKRR